MANMKKLQKLIIHIKYFPKPFINPMELRDASAGEAKEKISGANQSSVAALPPQLCSW